MARHAYRKMLASYGYKFKKPVNGQPSTESVYVHDGKHVYDTLTITRLYNGKHLLSFCLQSTETGFCMIDAEHTAEAKYMMKARIAVVANLRKIFGE